MTATTATIEEQLHEALRFLAGQCDFAKEKDGIGFSAIDAHFGHRLASLPALSPAQILVAAKIARKYRRQFDGIMDLPDMAEVEAYAQAAAITAPAKEIAGKAKEEEEENRVYIDDKYVVVAFPYDADKVAAMQPLKKSVKKWDFNGRYPKAWSFPVSALETVLAALAPFGDDFIYPAEIEAQRELVRQTAALEAQQRAEEIKAALSNVQPYLDGAALPGGRVLFEHQREAVRQLIEGQRMILAHDMGLGKTLDALVAAKAYDCAVIVVCPASLKINWLREAEQVGVAIEVWSWAKMPVPPECNYVLIGDESHYAQTMGTQRTAAFLALSEQARAVFALSGTPMKNGRPVNLFPLLVACNHPLADNRRDYEMRYCAAHEKTVNSKGKTAWDVTGAAHLDELYKKTSGSTILYKKKEECLKDLPQKIRVFREAEVSSQARKEYTATLHRLREESKARMKATKEEQKALIAAAIEAGEDLDDLDLKDDPENARAIVELGILRHAGSLAKVESAIEIAQEILEQGESIVIFTAYLDTLERIVEALPGSEVIKGSQTTEQRQAAIDRFQARQSRVIVAMLGAGGVGITLTAAQTVLLVDRPWTPGDAVQAEDRCHRIGQTGSVTAIWLQYEAIDAKVDALLQAKQERIELVLSGKRKTLRGIKSIAKLAKELLRSIKSGKALSTEEIEEDEEIDASKIVEGSLSPVEAPQPVALIAESEPAMEVPAIEEIAQDDTLGIEENEETRETPMITINSPHVTIELDERLQYFSESIDASLINKLLLAHFGIEEPAPTTSTVHPDVLTLINQVQTSLSQQFTAQIAELRAEIADLRRERNAAPMKSEEPVLVPVVSAPPSIEQRVHCYLAEQQALGNTPKLREIMEACQCGEQAAVKYRRSFNASTGAPALSIEQRVHRFLAEQYGQGHAPTLKEIMTACDCGEQAAVRYRRTYKVSH